VLADQKSLTWAHCALYAFCCIHALLLPVRAPAVHVMNLRSCFVAKRDERPAHVPVAGARRSPRFVTVAHAGSGHAQLGADWRPSPLDKGHAAALTWHLPSLIAHLNAASTPKITTFDSRSATGERGAPSPCARAYRSTCASASSLRPSTRASRRRLPPARWPALRITRTIPRQRLPT
jgi:hypothetical protein